MCLCVSLSLSRGTVGCSMIVAFPCHTHLLFACRRDFKWNNGFRSSSTVTVVTKDFSYIETGTKLKGSQQCLSIGTCENKS